MKIALRDILLGCFFLFFDFGVIITTSQLGDVESRLFIQRMLIIFSAVPLAFNYALGQKITLREGFCIIFFSVLSVIAFIVTQSFNILKLSLFILAVKGVSLRKVIFLNSIALFISMLLVMGSSIFGITDVFYREMADKFDLTWTTYVFGFINPNTPPTIIFSILTGYNIIYRHHLTIKVIFFEILISLLVFFLYSSRTGLFIIMGNSFLLLCYKLFPRWLIFKYLVKPLQYSFFFFTILSIWIIYNYNNLDENWRILDILLSNRLYLWKEFANLYGIFPLGINISNNDMPIDNGYIFILVYYGYIILAIYNLAFFYVSRYSYHQHEWVLLITMVSYSAYGFFETGILSFGLCNILLIFAILIMNRNKHKFISFNEESEVYHG